MDSYLNLSLYQAALNRNLEKVKICVQEGASLNWGLDGALLSGDLEIVDFLIDEGATELSLSNAAEGGHFNIIEKLIEMGVCDWDNGLYGAARNGDLQLVKFFITKGASNWDKGYIGACLGPRYGGVPSKEVITFFTNKGCPHTKEVEDYVSVLCANK